MLIPPRRAATLLLVLVALASGIAAAPVVTPSAPVEAAMTSQAAGRPNILVVMADDMRVTDLQFAPRTKRLLADAGVTFENSFSPFPLCCPARASFLTGQYAHNHGVLWHERPYGYGAFDDSATLATSLKAAGYRTGMVGKYLNRYGLDRSKVSGAPSATYVPRGWDDWHATVDGAPGHRGGTYSYFNTLYNSNGKVDASHRGDYQTNTVGDLTRDLLDDYRRGGKPFFLYVNYLAPHHGQGRNEGDDPRGVRDSRGRPVKVATPGVPVSVRGRFDRLITRPAGIPRTGGNGEEDVSDKPGYVRGRLPLSASLKRAMTELTRQRAEAISVMDRELARTISRLKKNGQWSSTVVVFTSDNGYALGEHRQPFGKVHAHEPVLRVPMIISAPGARSGESRYDPISTVDLSATLLELGGAVPPRPADGDSRVSTILQGDQGWDAPVVVESVKGKGGNAFGFKDKRKDPRTSIGLRTPQYSFVRYRNGDVELYDLDEDPLQLQSVHRDPAYAAVQRTLTDAWHHYAFCAGATCQRPLPDGLTATAGQNAARTDAYWARIDEVYGYR